MSDPYHWIHPHLPWRCQPMSHHTSNREVTTSRIPLQPISRSESPRDGTLGITRHWIQNDTNVGDKIDQPNQLKLCQIFKWCQTVEPFFVRKWLKDSHSLGWKASIYIYIHIYSCFGNKNPAVLGDIQLNGGRWWLDSLSLLDPVTMNERLLSWKRLMSPSPWTHILSVGCFRGVFLACTSINIISNTPEATPPNQLNGFVPRLLFSFLVHLLEDVRILENIREHHPMPRFASKPMARKYITIHLRNIYLKSYIIWPIFHKLFSFSKATWSRPFFPHEMHLKPHLTTSNNTKPSPYYPYTIHPIQWHFQFGNATTAVR